VNIKTMGSGASVLPEDPAHPVDRAQQERLRAQAAAARAQRDREAAALWEQAVRGREEPIGQSREALYNPNFAEFEALYQAQLQEWLRHARHAPNLDQQADRIQAHMRVLAGSKLLMPR
jgi:hypothetical protein